MLYIMEALAQLTTGMNKNTNELYCRDCLGMYGHDDFASS